MIYFTKIGSGYVGYVTGKEKSLSDPEIAKKISVEFGVDKESVCVSMKYDFTDLKPQEYTWIVSHPSENIQMMMPPKKEDGYILDTHYDTECYTATELTVYICRVETL